MTSCDIDALHKLRLKQELSIIVSLYTSLGGHGQLKFERGSSLEPNKQP